MISLTAQDYKDIAARLDCEVRAVKAVVAVEAPTGAFYADTAKSPGGLSLAGYPTILFEPHVFWRALKRQTPPYNPARLLTREDVKAAHGDISDILYERWAAGRYGASVKQPDRFNRAAELCRPAACEACSYGAFQLLGEGWRELGYEGPEEMRERMFSLAGQLEGFERFIKWKRLGPALRACDWPTFARGYNGTGQINEYSKRLAAEYAKASV